MTTPYLETAKAYARKESRNGYVQHVNIRKMPAGDYMYQVSDWYLGPDSIAGYENGSERYDYSDGIQQRTGFRL
jgi:hypothetical protein